MSPRGSAARAALLAAALARAASEPSCGLGEVCGLEDVEAVEEASVDALRVELLQTKGRLVTATAHQALPWDTTTEGQGGAYGRPWGFGPWIPPEELLEGETVNRAIAQFTLPAAIDEGNYNDVSGLIFSLSKDTGDADGGKYVRSAIARFTLPAAINNGYFSNVWSIITDLSNDDDAFVRWNVAKFTLPAAIADGRYSSVSSLIVQLSKDEEELVTSAIQLGHSKENASLAVSLSKDELEKEMLPTSA